MKRCDHLFSGTLFILVCGLLALSSPAIAVEPEPFQASRPCIDGSGRAQQCVELLDGERRPTGATRLEAIWKYSVGETKWLHVCWLNPDSQFSKEMAWTQNQVVDVTWGAHSDLLFLNPDGRDLPWAKCKSTDKHTREIRIKITTGNDEASRSHTPQFGQEMQKIQFPGATMMLNFGARFSEDGSKAIECAGWMEPTNPENREKCIRAIAAHEFGHAIGLFHEDMRDDVIKKCPGSEGDVPSKNLTDAPDQQSVMNYCAYPPINNGVLSTLDIASVQRMYCAKGSNCTDSMSTSEGR